MLVCDGRVHDGVVLDKGQDIVGKCFGILDTLKANSIKSNQVCFASKPFQNWQRVNLVADAIRQMTHSSGTRLGDVGLEDGHPGGADRGLLLEAPVEGLLDVLQRKRADCRSFEAFRLIVKRGSECGEECRT